MRVRRISSEGKLRAYATITFDKPVCYHPQSQGYRRKVVIVFVAMPSRKTKSGEFKDVAHPISSEFRTTMQEAILAAYEKAPPAGSADEDEDLIE